MKQILYILYTENNGLDEILKFTNCACKNSIIQEYNSLGKKGKLQKSLLLYLPKCFIIGNFLKI